MVATGMEIKATAELQLNDNPACYFYVKCILGLLPKGPGIFCTQKVTISNVLTTELFY